MTDFKSAFDVEVFFESHDRIWNIEIDGERVVDSEEVGDGDSVLYADEFEIVIDKAIELHRGYQMMLEINSAIDKLGLSFPEFEICQWESMRIQGWSDEYRKRRIQNYIETVLDSGTVSAWVLISTIFGLTDADRESAYEDAIVRTRYVEI